MNCFSMMRKFLGDRFFSHDPIPPKQPPIELKSTKQTEEKPLANKKEEKKHVEDDDLFKEMQPDYIAPRRIGATMLVDEKKVSSSRFNMEVDEGHAWDVEELY